MAVRLPPIGDMDVPPFVVVESKSTESATGQTSTQSPQVVVGARKLGKGVGLAASSMHRLSAHVVEHIVMPNFSQGCCARVTSTVGRPHTAGATRFLQFWSSW